MADSGRRGKAPKGQPGGKPGKVGAPQQKQQPQPLLYTRTAQVDSTEQAKRKDQLPISAATTAADVAKIVESKKGHAGLTEAQLDGFSKTAREAARFLLLDPPLPLVARPGYGTLASGAVSLVPDWARAMLRIPVPSVVAQRVAHPLGRLGIAAVRWGMAGVEARRPHLAARALESGGA